MPRQYSGVRISLIRHPCPTVVVQALATAFPTHGQVIDGGLEVSDLRATGQFGRKHTTPPMLSMAAEFALGAFTNLVCRLAGSHVDCYATGHPILIA